MRKAIPILFALAVVAAGYTSIRVRAAGQPVTRTTAQINQERVDTLIEAMRHVDLDALAPIEVKPLVLPEPSIDVMHVRLEETYDIAGVGKDTVELKGWIAVKHDHTHPGDGAESLTWNTAVTDTEFVAMDLRGESPIFGPVQVTLDKSVPSIGQVGNICLPFAVGSSLDAAYLPYRTLFHIDQDAANRIQGAPYALTQTKRPTAEPSLVVTGANARPVLAVIDGVLGAINKKDPKGMMKFYSASGNNLFFGQVPGGVARGSERYIEELSKTFKNIKTITAKRNDNAQVKVSGNLAIAAVTGVNDVVNAEGQQGSSPWRWTVELEKQRGKWKITHDHLSFFEDPNSPIERQAVSGVTARGVCCLANLAVNVSMNKLDLKMRTAEPVHWYSEVQTIPPVGHTASVSAVPTTMISAGRNVGTLQHGAVKFREIVKHVPLIDVARDDLRIASIRVPTAGPGGR
jgi:ketosteroid isomerase-like protein